MKAFRKELITLAKQQCQAKNVFQLQKCTRSFTVFKETFIRGTLHLFSKGNRQI